MCYIYTVRSIFIRFFTSAYVYYQDMDPYTMLYSVILGGLIMLILHYYAVTHRMAKCVKNIPGPIPLPVIGDSLKLNPLAGPYEFFQTGCKFVAEYGQKGISRAWAGYLLIIIITSPKYAEAILNDNHLLKKGHIYDFLIPWLGTGLLNSSGDKWKKHRKLITPTFHFKILENFLLSFCSNGNKLIKKLEKYIDGPEFDIYPYVKYCTLDIICETAMGININAQDNRDSEYVKAVSNMAAIITTRSAKPWLYPDFIFNLSKFGKLQRKSLNIIHNMTNKVISSRKAELGKLVNNSDSVEEEFGIKNRKAFLDLLLETAQNENTFLTDEEIREEVDTFMFEGHDTTTSAISFILSSIAQYPKVQERVYEEQKELFGNSDKEPSFSDLQEMKYLEAVIKETLRLFPSVPMYVRTLDKDIAVDGIVLPKGAQMCICPFMMHRNPDYFPDPEYFNPDRFLTENYLERNPFLYIPFSAGIRNCIGQKFALLQMKTIVSKMIRHYKLQAGSTTNSLPELTNELVLKNIRGIRIKVEKRNTNI